MTNCKFRFFFSLIIKICKSQVARYCAAQEDFDYDYYYYNGDYPEDSGPGCTDGTMKNFGNNPGKDLVQVTCTFDQDGGNDQTSVEYPLPEEQYGYLQMNWC